MLAAISKWSARGGRTIEVNRPARAHTSRIEARPTSSGSGWRSLPLFLTYIWACFWPSMSGINARYDRMIHTMNLTQHRQAQISRREHPGQQRRKSTPSGSSSGEPSSDAPPQTPVDTYSNLEERHLGADSAVLKMVNQRKRRHGMLWSKVVDNDVSVHKVSIAMFGRNILWD
jgi:hypothetical protein